MNQKLWGVALASFALGVFGAILIGPVISDVQGFVAASGDGEGGPEVLGNTQLKAQVARLQQELAQARDEISKRQLLRSEPGRSRPARSPQLEKQLVDCLAWLKLQDADRFGELTLDELAGLQKLDLSGLALTAEDLRKLVALANLNELNLAGAGITDLELAALADLRSLQSLNLANALITDAGLEHLSKMRGLLELELGNTEITDVGLAQLAHLGKLSKIILDGTKITDAGLLSLAGLPIRKLGLGRTGVTDTGLATLRGFQLEELSLYRNTNISDVGMRHLDTQAELRKLNLRGVKVTAKGLACLQNMTSLKELNASLSMTDAGMAHLQNLTSLRRLGLYSNPNITDVGVAHLRQLKSLQSLHLQFTKISDKGLAHLEDLPLRFLDVRGTQVTDTGRKDYRSRHRYCRVLK
ncbi:MAG: hypothetical protein V3U11_11860 [Planctomycetota bacterium]